MPAMVTSTYQNLVRNILALVLGTLKIFTYATRKCRLKGKIVLCAPPTVNYFGFKVALSRAWVKIFKVPETSAKMLLTLFW